MLEKVAITLYEHHVKQNAVEARNRNKTNSHSNDGGLWKYLYILYMYIKSIYNNFKLIQ